MHSAIHDPFAGTTPSQRLAAAAHDIRLAKIAARAVADTPLACPSASQRSLPVTGIEQLPEPLSIGDWICRQEYLNPLPKKTWFSVEKDMGPVEPMRPTIDQILRAVCGHYEVSRSDILSERRTASIVRPRQLVYYLARMLTFRSLPEIGRRIGGRDHTSVLSGVGKIERLLLTDVDLAEDVAAIMALLGAPNA